MRSYEGSVGQAITEIRKLRDKLIQGLITQEEYELLIKPYLDILDNRGKQLKTT